MENSIYLDEARDPLIIAESWMKDGKDVAIATVVETWGSAPRPVGSHLVIDAEGNFHGSVSGGCVEGAVVSEAQRSASALRLWTERNSSTCGSIALTPRARA